MPDTIASKFLDLGQRPQARLVVPLAAVTLAALTQFAFYMESVPGRYFIYCGAVILSALAGRWLGGLLAISLSLLIILLTSSHGGRALLGSSTLFAHLAFIGLCLAETWLVNALLDARSKAMQLASVRNELLSMASHDVRSPLMAIGLQLHSILRLIKRPDGMLDQAAVETRLRVIASQVHRIDELLGDLLDASRLDAGQVRVKWVNGNLSAALRSVLERHAEALSQAKCPVVTDLPDELPGWWDLLRCEQVMTNLLTNAMKYGGGKPIHLAVCADGDDVYIKVRDEGIGIAAEHQEVIFRRFERVGHTEAFHGHGLGLWIVRRIVEAMGGTIVVQSQLGQGATFIVGLPIHRQDPRRSHAGTQRDTSERAWKSRAERTPCIEEHTKAASPQAPARQNTASGSPRSA